MSIIQQTLSRSQMFERKHRLGLLIIFLKDPTRGKNQTGLSSFGNSRLVFFWSPVKGEGLWVC